MSFSERALNPHGIAAPFGRYVHGIEIPASARIVMTSGQLALAKDGSVPEGVEKQSALCFANIDKILAEAGMTRADIVKLSAFVTDRTHMAGYMRARDDFLHDVDPPPASTLLIVSGFTRPEFLVEIEAIAAK
jgi:enamine deaminase RidA (YjgF/YER057c/UK114 family)